MNKYLTPVRSTLCLVLALSLVATSGEAVPAALALRPPSAEMIHKLSFLRNQEKLRLEMEALSERMINTRISTLLRLETFPFPGQLLGLFKPVNLLTADQTVGGYIKTKIEAIQDWFDTPLFPRFPSFKRSYVGAALVMLIVSQLQTWLAVSSGVIIACGNYIEFGNRPLKDTLNHMRGPTNDLINRGVLSMGGYFMVPVREKVPAASQIAGFPAGDKAVPIWKYYGSKQLVLKRDSPVDLLFSALNKEAERAEKDRDPNVLQNISSVEVHSRFATTGDDGSTLDELTDAAQPGIAPGHWELRWEAQKTVTGVTQVPQYVWVENHYQFNGDLNQTKLLQLKMDPQVVIKNQEARDRMLRWLGLASITSGDAPLEALYQEMFYTERMWYASIRYAMFAHLSQPGDGFDRNPPIQNMRQWEVLFQHAYRDFLTANPAQGWVPGFDDQTMSAKEIQARLQQQADSFREYLGNLLHADSQELINFVDRTEGKVSFEMIKDLRQTVGAAHLETFLKAATIAFNRNSLEYATIREVKPRTIGTFGGSHLSTLNPPGSRVMNVTSSNGQGMVVAFDKEGKQIAITSDRIIQQQFPQDDADQALVLDDTGNESLVSGMDRSGRIRMTLYSGPDSIVVSEQEVRRRMRPLRDSEEPDVFAPSKGLPTLNRMDAGARAAAMQIDNVLQKWKDVRNGIPSRNRQTASEIIRLSIQQRIYEFIRKRIGVNERRLPAEIDERIWQQADYLSRASWLRTGPGSMSEAQIMEAAEAFAREAEKTMIDKAPLRIGIKPVHELLQEAAEILERALGAKKDRAQKEESALRAIAGKIIGALNLGGNGHRLEEQSADIVLIGTESSLLALEKFGLYQLGPMLGMRVKVISGNDFLEAANLYNTDPAGFMKALGINSKRTILMQASDSAETFEAGVDSAWAVTTVRELFTLTGSKDNRLVDRVKKLRSMSTHNPGSKSYDNLKSYVAMIQTLNEFALFWGESVTSRFETGGDDWDHKPFFQTPFTKDQMTQILEPSNERFVKEIAPVILGYHSSGHEIKGETSDRAKLEGLGTYLGTRQLEMVRLWFMEKAYLVLTVLFAILTDIGLVHFQVFGATPGVGAKLISYGVGLAVGFSLGVALLLGMRQLRKALGWHAPKFLAGFGAPSFIFADKYRYVYHFLMLYARTGFGKAYGINSAPFFGTSVNDLIDDYKATANRRAVILIGRPGPNHPALETADSSAEMAGRQLKSLLNLPFRWMKIFGIKPVAPEVIMMGHYTPPANDRWWRMARDKDIDFAPNNVLWTPPGKSLADMPTHLVRYYEDNYGGFGRMLGGVRALATQVKKVSNHAPWFKPAEYQGGYRIKSTQGPVPGAPVLEQVQTMQPKLIPIEPVGGEIAMISQLPVVINDRPIDAVWTSDLPLHGNGKKHHVYPPARPATQQPGSLPADYQSAPPVFLSDKVRHFDNGKSAETATEKTASIAVSGNGAHGGHQAVAEMPIVIPSRVEKIPTSDLRARMERLNKRRPRSTSSMILKSALTSTDRSAPASYAFNADGTVGDANSGTLTDAQLAVLEELAQPLAEPLNGTYSLVIADIDNRAAFFQPENKSKKSPKGLLVLDRAMLDDAVNGVVGAKAVLNLEFSGEMMRLQELSQGLAKTQKEESPANLERRLARLKITMFLGYKPKLRQSVIQYLQSHTVYDPEEFSFAEKIYGEANTTYTRVYTSTRKTVRSKEEADQIANRAALDAVKDRLYRYVNKVMDSEEQPQILWPAEPVAAERIEQIEESNIQPQVEPAAPAVLAAPIVAEPLRLTFEQSPPSVAVPEVQRTRNPLKVLGIAALSLLGIVIPAAENQSLKLSRTPTHTAPRADIHLKADAPLKVEVKPLPPAPVATPVIRVSPKEGEGLQQFMLRLRRDYPALRNALKGSDTSVAPGTPMNRLWMNFILPQTKQKEADPEHLSGADTFDLSGMAQGSQPAPKQKVTPKKRVSHRGVPAILITVGASLAAMLSHLGTTLQAAGGPVAISVHSAVQNALTSTGLPFYHVKAGDTLSHIAQNAHVSLSELLSWNPDLVSHPGRIIAGKDIVYIPSAQVSDAIGSAVHSLSIPPPPAVPDLVQNLLSQILPEALWVAVISAVLVLTLGAVARYSSGHGLGPRLKAAFAGLALTIQVGLPSAVAFAVPGRTTSEPTPATVTAAESDSPIQAIVLPREKSLLQSARAPVVRDVPSLPQVSDAGFTFDPMSAEAPAPIADIQKPHEDQKAAASETPEPQAIARYRLAVQSEKYARKDFWNLIVGQPEKRSRWSLLNPRRTIVNPIVRGFGNYGEKATGPAQALQAYALLLAEDDYLRTMQDIIAHETVYKAAQGWEQSQRALWDSASQTSAGVSAPAQETWVEAQSELNKAKAQWEATQIKYAALKTFVRNPLSKEDSELEPLWKRLRFVEETRWQADRDIKARREQAGREVQRVLQGAMPPAFAYEALDEDQRAIVYPRVVSLLGEKRYWELEKSRLTQILSDVQTGAPKDQPIADRLLLEITAVSAKAGFQAATLAASAGLDLGGVKEQLPTEKAKLYQLPDSAEEFPQAPNQTGPRFNPKFEDPDTLSAKVAKGVEAHADASKTYVAAQSALLAAEARVRENLLGLPTLVKPLEDAITAVKGLVEIKAQTGELSNTLLLALGRDPNELIKGTSGELRYIKSVVLPAPEVPVVSAIDASEWKKLHDEREWQRNIKSSEATAKPARAPKMKASVKTTPQPNKHSQLPQKAPRTSPEPDYSALPRSLPQAEKPAVRPSAPKSNEPDYSALPKASQKNPQLNVLVVAGLLLLPFSLANILPIAFSHGQVAMLDALGLFGLAGYSLQILGLSHRNTMKSKSDRLLGESA